MTVNDILARMYEIDKIIHTLDYAPDDHLIISHIDGNTPINVEKLKEILKDYKAMLGNMKVKE